MDPFTLACFGIGILWVAPWPKDWESYETVCKRHLETVKRELHLLDKAKARTTSQHIALHGHWDKWMADSLDRRHQWALERLASAEKQLQAEQLKLQAKELKRKAKELLRS